MWEEVRGLGGGGENRHDWQTGKGVSPNGLPFKKAQPSSLLLSTLQPDRILFQTQLRATQIPVQKVVSLCSQDKDSKPQICHQGPMWGPHPSRASLHTEHLPSLTGASSPFPFYQPASPSTISSVISTFWKAFPRTGQTLLTDSPSTLDLSVALPSHMASP